MPEKIRFLIGYLDTLLVVPLCSWALWYNKSYTDVTDGKWEYYSEYHRQLTFPVNHT